MTQRTLYEVTGDIKDVNTLLVQRDYWQAAQAQAAAPEKARKLYIAAHNLMVYLGREGSISSDSHVTDTLMNCLHDIDDGDFAFPPAPSAPIKKETLPLPSWDEITPLPNLQTAVEPYIGTAYGTGPLYTESAIAAAHAAGRKSVHDSCVDLWKEEVIAAARCKALEEAAKKVDSLADSALNTSQQLALDVAADAIRTLIGKEST